MDDYKLLNLFSVPLAEFDYNQISEQDHQKIREILQDTTQNVSNKTSRETYVLDKQKYLSCPLGQILPFCLI